MYKVKCKSKATPVQTYNRPIGSQEFDTSRFRDSRHMKVVRLLALRTALGNIQVHLLKQHYFGGMYIARGGEHSWYSFLLEDELIPGPQCGRKV